MKLFPRLFFSHLLVIVVALGALLLVAELLAPAFIRHHVEQMVALIGPNGASLRPDLERGVRGTLTSALIASVPLSLGVAALTALFSARRMMHSVALLRDGSRAIAAGEYTRRLPERGHDELTDLARHFNRMASALEQVERGRVELITNVAHELGTPLSALRGYAEALERSGDGPRHRLESDYPGSPCAGAAGQGPQLGVEGGSGSGGTSPQRFSAGEGHARGEDAL